MDEQVIRQVTEQAQTASVFAKWLLGILSGAGAVIAGLFWQLLKAKDETNKAYKEVAPIAIASLESARNLERLVARLENDKGASGVEKAALAKSVERLEEVAKRLESVERDRQ